MFVGDEKSFLPAPAGEQSLAQLYGIRTPPSSPAHDVRLWIAKKLTPLQKIIHVGRVATCGTVESAAGLFGAIIRSPVQRRRSARSSRRGRSAAALAPCRCARRHGRGNIANGSPISDLAPMLIALNATLELRRGDQVRKMPLENFFLVTANRIAGGQICASLLVPSLRRVGSACKITKRFDGHFRGAVSFVFESRRQRIGRAGRLRRHGRHSPNAQAVEEKLRGIACGARWLAKASMRSKDSSAHRSARQRQLSQPRRRRSHHQGAGRNRGRGPAIPASWITGYSPMPPNSDVLERRCAHVHKPLPRRWRQACAGQRRMRRYPRADRHAAYRRRRHAGCRRAISIERGAQRAGVVR